jgi:hypothetical protein
VDVRKLERLIAFMPDLRQNVRASLTVTPADLRSALGDPVAIAALVEELAGAPLPASRRAAIETELRATAVSSHLSDNDLLEELAHTNAELARHWFNCIHRAWNLWGSQSGRLLLGEQGPLLPDRQGCPDSAKGEWDEFYAAAKEGLYASIAIDEDGRRLAREGFVANLRRALDRGPVELPRSLLLTKAGSQIVVTRARA